MDEELKRLLLPFAQAYWRMLYYGSTVEGGSPNQAIAPDGYELLAVIAKDSLEPAIVRGEEDVQLNMSHLGAIYKYLSDKGELPELDTEE